MTEDDGDDHTVNTQDTGHDDRDEGLHDDCGAPDGDAADACAGFGCAVGCAEIFIDMKEILASTKAMVTPMKPKNDDPSLKASV